MSVKVTLFVALLLKLISYTRRKQADRAYLRFACNPPSHSPSLAPYLLSHEQLPKNRPRRIHMATTDDPLLQKWRAYYMNPSSRPPWETSSPSSFVLPLLPSLPKGTSSVISLPGSLFPSSHFFPPIRIHRRTNVGAGVWRGVNINSSRYGRG